LHAALASSALGLRHTAASPSASGHGVAEERPLLPSGRTRQHPDPPRSAPAPRTAILLVGLMNEWEDHIDLFMSRMVLPNKADVFIHTTGMPGNLAKRLGGSLKAIVDEELKVPSRRIHMQFWHLEQAFELMARHEVKEGLQYDVVVRARSDVVPVPPSQLNLSEWRPEEGDKLHMMSDMVFWGGRRAMAKVAKFWSAIRSYYTSQYPDPMKRHISVLRLLDSLQRDPWVNRRSEDAGEPWTLYQKLPTLPYPDMGEVGAVENLRAAAKRGVLSWPPASGPPGEVHCGDVCNEKDYRPAWPQSEKDILHFAMINDLTVCDVGASMRWLKVKGDLMERKLSSDCNTERHG